MALDSFDGSIRIRFKMLLTGFKVMTYLKSDLTKTVLALKIRVQYILRLNHVDMYLHILLV